MATFEVGLVPIELEHGRRGEFVRVGDDGKHAVGCGVVGDRLGIDGRLEAKDRRHLLAIAPLATQATPSFLSEGLALS